MVTPNMPKILSLILSNLGSKPETRRFPERVAPEGRYRGPVVVNPERCIACGICDHVCVSGAIEVWDAGDHVTWNYDPGHCTFCATCVGQCPAGALKQQNDGAPAYSGTGGLRVHIDVPYPACKECGAIIAPAPTGRSRGVFTRSVDEVRADARLCHKCRLQRDHNRPAEKKADDER
jgi:ferredoxin